MHQGSDERPQPHTESRARAFSKLDRCLACDGERTVFQPWSTEPKPCLSCFGTGRAERHESADARDDDPVSAAMICAALLLAGAFFACIGFALKAGGL